MMDEKSRDFLLKEYETMFEMNKYMYEIHYRWVRFYWIMAAAVFVSIYSVREKLINEIDTFKTVAVSLLVLLAVVGFCVFFLSLYARVRSVEFFNAVNRIRKFFKEGSQEWQDIFFLPTEDQRLFRIGGLDFMSTVILILLNSVFIALPFSFSLSELLRLTPELSGGFPVLVISIGIHCLCWWLIFKIEGKRLAKVTKPKKQQA